MRRPPRFSGQDTKLRIEAGARRVLHTPSTSSTSTPSGLAPKGFLAPLHRQPLRPLALYPGLGSQLPGPASAPLTHATRTPGILTNNSYPAGHPCRPGPNYRFPTQPTHPGTRSPSWIMRMFAGSRASVEHGGGRFRPYART
jgi:hypothetical protein